MKTGMKLVLSVALLSSLSIASIDFQLNDLLAFDTYEENRDMGGFILIDKVSDNTVAAGMISQSLEKEEKPHPVADSFEVEFNALVRRHFPHWNAAVIK